MFVWNCSTLLSLLFNMSNSAIYMITAAHLTLLNYKFITWITMAWDFVNYSFREKYLTNSRKCSIKAFKSYLELDFKFGNLTLWLMWKSKSSLSSAGSLDGLSVGFDNRQWSTQRSSTKSTVSSSPGHSLLGQGLHHIYKDRNIKDRIGTQCCAIKQWRS